MQSIGRGVEHRSRPQVSGAVGYVFGVLDASAVPGSVLVPLLADLGMSPAAVRAMLHRMVATGSLARHRVGRVAVYRLAGAYAERFQRFRAGDETPVWQGRFHVLLYDIPETRRHDRDELREVAFRAGYGAPRPGVLIGLSDPLSWSQPWLDRDDLTVDVGELACSLATARRLAERAWGLTALRPALTAFAAHLADAADTVGSGGYDDRAAFQLQAGLWERWVAILVRLPALPAALTPDPWPAAELASRLLWLTEQLQVGALAHGEAVVATAERGDLLERLPRRRYPRAE